MERNLSDQKLSLCSAVAVLNKMFLTQNLSPYPPCFLTSSTVDGISPGCKEENKREGGREREMGGGGEKGRERERERERAVIFTGTVY